MRSILQNISIVFLLVFLSGCLRQPNQQESEWAITSTATQSATLLPYWTPTSTTTPKPPKFKPEIPVTPMPSSTPFTYQIRKGDTLLGLAIQYSVKLEDLLSVNPEIDPRILSVGQEIIIPIFKNETATEVNITPTPIPVPVDQPRCYDLEDGLTCIVSITNDQQVTLEGIRVGIGIFNALGEILSSNVSIPALNRLLPGETMPVVVLFGALHKSSLPEDYLVQANVISAISTSGSDDDRYVEVILKDINVNLAPSKLFADVSGLVDFPTPADQVWLLGVAFDSEGQAIGMRKVKLNSQCKTTQANQETGNPTDTSVVENGENCPSMKFQLVVYSLEPEISSVKIFSEAVP